MTPTDLAWLAYSHPDDIPRPVSVGVDMRQLHALTALVAAERVHALCGGCPPRPRAHIGEPCPTKIRAVQAWRWCKDHGMSDTEWESVCVVAGIRAATAHAAMIDA